MHLVLTQPWDSKNLRPGQRFIWMELASLCLHGKHLTKQTTFLAFIKFINSMGWLCILYYRGYRDLKIVALFLIKPRTYTNTKWFLNMCDSTAKLQFLFREVECAGGIWTYIHEQALGGGGLPWPTCYSSDLPVRRTEFGSQAFLSGWYTECTHPKPSPDVTKPPECLNRGKGQKSDSVANATCMLAEKWLKERTWGLNCVPAHAWQRRLFPLVSEK